MVKRGDDFVVSDAKTGEDITRSVLAQIIFDQEGKSRPEPAARDLSAAADPLLRRQRCRCWCRAIWNSRSTSSRPTSNRSFREQMDTRLRGQDDAGLRRSAAQMFDQLEDQTRKNMKMFSQALTMFNPFTGAFAPGSFAPNRPCRGRRARFAPTAAQARRSRDHQARHGRDAEAPRPAGHDEDVSVTRLRDAGRFALHGAARLSPARPRAFPASSDDHASPRPVRRAADRQPSPRQLPRRHQALRGRCRRITTASIAWSISTPSRSRRIRRRSNRRPAR